MSNRKKPEPQKPEGYKPSMTVVPSIYVSQYEFVPEAGGLIGFRFGRAGQTHADVTMTMNLAIDMMNKLQATVIEIARQQQAAATPPAAEYPTDETPGDQS